MVLSSSIMGKGGNKGSFHATVPGKGPVPHELRDFPHPGMIKNLPEQDVINSKNWNYSYLMAERGDPIHDDGLGRRESSLLKPFVIGAFALIAILLNLYALGNAGDPVVLQISQLLPHLYYIPIILASVWYPKRGPLLIGLVVGVSLGMVLFSLVNGTFTPVILVYTAMYVWVVAIISVFTMEQWGSLSRILHSMRRDRPAGTGKGKPAPAKNGAEGGRPRGEDVASLLAMLGAEDNRVRVAAITSLGRSGDPGAVAPLIGLLGDGNRGIREAAVRALGALGGVAVEPLVRALTDRDWHIRMGSAIALRIIGDARAVEPLIQVLTDGNRFVRREAAKSLGRIGDRRATGPLISLLGDSDTGVRVRAAAALGKIGDPVAIDPLTRALEDRDSELQEAAGEALSRLKNTITSPD
jgi:hypothetical protein